MDDLIRRQAAIEAVGDVHPLDYNGQAILTRLKELPTIDTVKRGKWLKIEGCNTVQCSVCFDDFDYIDGLCYLCHGQELPNYCPNCGAMMERSEE